MEMEFLQNSKSLFYSYNVHLRKFKFQLLGIIQGVHRTPKVGCVFKMFKIKLFCCFNTQLVNKLHQWSLYEVIEVILPFVLNTKRPPNDIWLLCYKQNSFGCFLKKLKKQSWAELGKAQSELKVKVNVRVEAVVSSSTTSLGGC